MIPIKIYFCILGMMRSFKMRIGSKRIIISVAILIPALAKYKVNLSTHFPPGIVGFQKNAIGVH